MINGQITVDDLKHYQSRFFCDQDQADISRGDRNYSVKLALEQGWTHQAISDATGLSRSRIAQIKATNT